MTLKLGKLTVKTMNKAGIYLRPSNIAKGSWVATVTQFDHISVISDSPQGALDTLEIMLKGKKK